MSAESVHMSTFGAETETEAEIRSTSSKFKVVSHGKIFCNDHTISYRLILIKNIQCNDCCVGASRHYLSCDHGQSRDSSGLLLLNLITVSIYWSR